MEYDFSDIDFVERMLGALPSLLYFKDAQGRYVFSTKYWNHIKCDGENWSIRGKTDLEVRKNRDNALLAMEEDRKILTTGIGTTYTIKEHVEGVAEYMEVIKRPVFDEDGQIIGIVGLINDITEREELRIRWEHSAHTVALTGVYNRSYLDDIKESFEPEQYPIGVVMADCDNLKIVNDTMGHAAGDDFIRSAAVALRSAMPADALIFRIGGDEFVVLLLRTAEHEVLPHIEAAQQLLEQMSVGGMPLSMSFGVSALTAPGEPVERAIERADREMYVEKKLHHVLGVE